MRCLSCEARVPEGAEFCRECGNPTRSSLRERLAGAQQAAGAGLDDAEALKAKRRQWFIVAAAFAFGLVIGGQAFNGFDTDFDFDPPVPLSSRPAVAEAQQLYDAYQEDPDAANERYGNRGLVVTGEFVRIVHDGQGNPDLRLKTSDPENPLGADILGDYFDDSTNLKPGQLVTLSCDRITGGGDDRWLQNCAIEEERLALVAPDTVPPAGSPVAPAEPDPTAPAEAPSPSD